MAASLKADPQLSNREHARRTGVDDKTVATVRRPLEESAEIPHFSERIDPRTGEATQPATKATITRTATEREVIDADIRHPFLRIHVDSRKREKAPPPHKTGGGAVRIALSASQKQP